MPDELIAEQIEYYRARAPEYDEWCDRRGGYDLGPEANALWERDVAVVENALDAFVPAGRVLELACGTGWWTQRLARHAGELTCVDASAETIAIARQKASARYIVADIFTWEPEQTYDVVLLQLLDLARPAGTVRVVLVDGRSRARAGWTSVLHRQPAARPSRRSTASRRSCNRMCSRMGSSHES